MLVDVKDIRYAKIRQMCRLFAWQLVVICILRVVYRDVCVDKGSYSTGSEASTDVSTSSLENLSTTARQEPQGEETADLTSGLFDAAGASSSSLSSVGGDDDDDDDAKLSRWRPLSTPDDTCVTVTASPSLAGYGPVVSAGSANSLIRQLLQNSPQYAHLLSDLEPAASPGVAAVEGKRTGSPKSALRGGGRSDGRSLPDTPTTTSSRGSGQSINRRLVNRYVNIDDDPASRSPPQRKYRDKPRPSTAPSGGDHPQPTTSMAPVTRVQTVADPVERHRSFELVDRVTGATLPRPTSNQQRKQTTTVTRPGLPQSAQPEAQQQRTSPPQRSSPSTTAQHHQQLRANVVSDHDQQTSTSTSSSSSLCVEQQCSTGGDIHSSSTPTVW